nr:DNA-binding protein [Ignicoccus islandicus]
MSIDERELEELKRRKLMELQRELESKKAEEQRRAKEELIREEILRRALTSEARQRLANVKLVRPELAIQVENYIIALAQAGRIPRPITDEELKEILAKLTAHERSTGGRINIKERGWK